MSTLTKREIIDEMISYKSIDCRTSEVAAQTLFFRATTSYGS